MEITREYLAVCRERFVQLWDAEQDVQSTYMGILGKLRLGWTTFHREHGVTMPSVSIWAQAIEDWTSKARAMRPPRDDFEHRCSELATYRSSTVFFNPPDFAAEVSLESRIVRVLEELYFTRSFPERLVWSLQLALGLGSLLVMYRATDSSDSWFRDDGFGFERKPLQPCEVAQAIQATKSNELVEQHKTLKALRSGEWQILPIAQFLGKALGVESERALRVLLVTECVEGHCLLLAAQEEFHAREDPDARDPDFMHLIGHLCYKRTMPFRRISELIDELPTDILTEPPTMKESVENALRWDLVHDACLCFPREVEHLMAAAMNEDKESVVRALLAVKGHAQVLARLVARRPET
jgi:hypothetical protein